MDYPIRIYTLKEMIEALGFSPAINHQNTLCESNCDPQSGAQENKSQDSRSPAGVGRIQKQHVSRL